MDCRTQQGHILALVHHHLQWGSMNHGVAREVGRHLPPSASLRQCPPERLKGLQHLTFKF
ncbi:hypothetical protein Patl1_33087 [Pistacia atlantica]|uniref:Uncharacterized protein n=1 Tax=Pistacia atlantica TaxID=434234 RepID=A0ACC1AQK3_9ROSI|nr:hypothetical protein Patl1_33087 [Pistacia atlantica]